MIVQAYLCFEGRSEEAIEFYKTALGANVEMLMRFKDMPQDAGDSENCGPEGESPAEMPNAEKVMHACLSIGQTQIMISDGRCQGPAKFEGITLSIAVGDTAKAEQVFNALAKGGEAKMPIAKTFFSPAFGMLTDQFGVPWMVSVATEE